MAISSRPVAEPVCVLLGYVEEGVPEPTPDKEPVAGGRGSVV